MLFRSQYGDDIRDIDWNVTARYVRPYVKVSEEDRELTLMLLIDVPGSRDFGLSVSPAETINRKGRTERLVRPFLFIVLPYNFICSAFSVYCDPAACHIVKTWQKGTNRCFSTSRRTFCASTPPKSHRCLTGTSQRLRCCNHHAEIGRAHV